MSDSGLYTVVAKNDLGEVTTEGRLYVKGITDCIWAPRRFAELFSDNCIGCSVTLMCGVIFVRL